MRKQISRMNPVLMWSLAVFGIALSVYVISIFLSPDNVGLSSVKALVRTKFPKAPQLSTQQLENWMQEKNSKPILILDIREKVEYDISHLPDAVWMDPNTPTEEALEKVSQAERVVAYCSVGYRSSQFISRLIHAGSKKELWNLEGSIFQWANEDRPIVDLQGDPAALVHPYNATAGSMLQSSKRAKTQPIKD